MLSNPIFIVGTERSGSNLLRLMLDAHSKIAVPHPPHLMRDLAGLEPAYGDLRRDKHFARLAADVASLVNMHFAPWPFEVKAAELIRASERRSLYGLYAALYDLYAKSKGKERWGCKSTFMYQQIGEILQNHPEPRFLHLVRDPRDVAASASESIFSKFHPFREGELWAAQQSEIESWRERMGSSKYLLVRYEDLTADPEKVLRRVMAFLGEGFEPAQLEYFKRREAGELAGWSESWRNVSQPVLPSRVGRYRKKLSAEDVLFVEHHAWELMKRYGYEPESPIRPAQPGALKLFEVDVKEKCKKVETEARALFRDRNFGVRWKRWFFLQYLKGTRSHLHG